VVLRDRSSSQMLKYDGKLPYRCASASPSLDLWSLGVMLYYMSTGSTLFLSNVEDNLIDSEDMRRLLTWSPEIKAQKLSTISDRNARNLTSLLLSYAPTARPTCERVLTHPFITGKSPCRLVGEEATWDVFISYRVASDAAHAKLLHDALTAVGVRVWWDAKCLEPGVPWEEGFCRGLTSSASIICLLSREAINSSVDPSRNISVLVPSSACDNVLLEWRLALELKVRGMIDKIFPVLIGNKVEDNGQVTYGHYFKDKCHPVSLEDVVVSAIEQKLLFHLDSQGLGLPYEPSMGVKSIVGAVTSNQGGFWENEQHAALSSVVDTILLMCKGPNK
jgi:hypothetical protein